MLCGHGHDMYMYSTAVRWPRPLIIPFGDSVQRKTVQTMLNVICFRLLRYHMAIWRVSSPSYIYVATCAERDQA